jgi:glucokinase
LTGGPNKIVPGTDAQASLPQDGRTAACPGLLALDFGGSKIAAAVCRTDGSVVTEGVVDTVPDLGARATFERAIALSTRLLEGATRQLADETTGARGGVDHLVAVGACTFGIPHATGVALSPAIVGWEELALEEELAACFRVPVRVVNDVKAAAVAEATSGALRGADPGIYLNLGTGLAAAVTTSVGVINGAHGAAGEIGYCLGSSWPQGISVGDSVRGNTAEEIVSGMGLARALAEAGGVSTPDGEPTSWIFEHAGEDPRLAAIVERFVDELAFHLVNLAVTIDPERIAVGGGLAAAWTHFEPALRSALDNHVPYPPELVLGAFPFDAPLRGAIAEAMKVLEDPFESAACHVATANARVPVKGTL